MDAPIWGQNPFEIPADGPRRWSPTIVVPLMCFQSYLFLVLFSVSQDGTFRVIHFQYFIDF